MRTTIDRAGRVVIPKALRDRLLLHEGQELEVIERDGVIEIEPASTPVELVDRGSGLVAVPQDAPRTPLTDEIVRGTIEATRR